MAVPCLSCHKSLEDYKSLALHIASEKKGHRRGKKWAARYLTNVRILDRKKDKPEGRIPLTDEEKAVKASAFREVSGEVESRLCVCPHCKQGHPETLEVEFAKGTDTWKVKTGLPVVMCAGCRG
jgi:hypothetical protein